MEISLQNTLSGQKEIFKPLQKGKVGMYHCGPTVYDYLHVGHLRVYTLADLLRRLFESEGYSVLQVINITDVGHLTSDQDEGEDKMELKAKGEGKSAHDIAKYFTDVFYEDLKRLNIKIDDTRFPAASEHITEQIKLLEELEKNGHTYKTSDGIYFDTSTFKDYGKLGHINLAGLEEGARIGINNEKKNPTDFALWKFSRPEERRQQEWPSPWGVGYPGWHLECSAMSMKYLGETFDIHTGGIDHIPVHHNNEIAQSESATGKNFADYWLHGAFVNIEGTKISKSLKNGIRLVELEEKGLHPLALKYWFYTSHYRTPTNFTEEAIKSADTAYRKILDFLGSNKNSDTDSTSASFDEIDEYKRRFADHMRDDLDTPKAISVMWEMIKDNSLPHSPKADAIYFFDQYLGLNLKKEAEINMNIEIPKEVQSLINDREAARKEKDWSKADELRQKISEFGYEIKDTENGSHLRKI
jgi:cysteinyl-tRNA synthetase